MIHLCGDRRKLRQVRVAPLRGLEVTAVARIGRPANDLHVLLRHRPPSISCDGATEAAPTRMLTQIRALVVLGRALLFVLRAWPRAALEMAGLTRMRVVRESCRRNRECEACGQQHGCDLLAHFSSPSPRLTTILSDPSWAGNEPLDPKTMQTREPVPNCPVPTGLLLKLLAPESRHVAGTGLVPDSGDAPHLVPGRQGRGNSVREPRALGGRRQRQRGCRASLCASTKAPLLLQNGTSLNPRRLGHHQH
jgi:hypothetical protein